jgi:hypothetical protein
MPRTAPSSWSRSASPASSRSSAPDSEARRQGLPHAGQTSIQRTQETWQNARLIHLPIHASWLNRIELYFSIVQRKALTLHDFDSLDALTERRLSFGEHYRHIARPFDWSFTRD